MASTTATDGTAESGGAASSSLFFQIPLDVFATGISSRLSVGDLLSLAQVSRRCNALAEHNTVWRQKYARIAFKYRKNKDSQHKGVPCAAAAGPKGCTEPEHYTNLGPPVKLLRQRPSTVPRAEFKLRVVAAAVNGSQWKERLRRAKYGLRHSTEARRSCQGRLENAISELRTAMIGLAALREVNEHGLSLELYELHDGLDFPEQFEDRWEAHVEADLEHEQERVEQLRAELLDARQSLLQCRRYQLRCQKRLAHLQSIVAKHQYRAAKQLRRKRSAISVCA